MAAEVMKPRRVYVAHGDSKTREILETILHTLGHEVAASTPSGRYLKELAIDSPADVLIASPKLSDSDGIETLIQIGEVNPTPAILVSRSDDLEKVERAMEDHVMAYLVEPVTADMLQPAIYLCQRRFAHFQQLTKKIEWLEQHLSERRVIEQAKAIIMQVRGMNEAEAHRYLQKAANRSRKKMVDVAESVIEAGDLLRPTSDK